MALDVYLTSACNLRCRFCFKLDHEDAPRIPLDDIRAILDSAYRQGHRYVSFSGGEPFLYKDIFCVLDHAHDLGYWISILSHGGLVDESMADRLNRYWRLRIRISLDGPDHRTHDYVRGAGTFDRTMSKIGLLLSHGCNVGLGVTVTEHNLNSVEDILRLCVHKGIAFVRCIPVARIKKGKAAHVTVGLHERLLETLIRFAIDHPLQVELPQPGHGQAPASIDVLTTRRCMAGTQFFGVTSDRRLVPCALIEDHPDVPSVPFEGGESFRTLGRQMDALFEQMKDRLGGICGTCEFRAVCYGGCLAEKLSFDRRFEEEQPICTKLILERIAARFDAADIERIVRSWVWQLQNSLEPNASHACMRQAPYWNLNFQVRNPWAATPLRFN